MHKSFTEWLDGHVGAVLAILAGLIVVWQRTDNKTLKARIVTLLGSGFLAAAIGGEVATWAGWPPGITYAAVAVLGPLILEVAAALVQDPARLIDLYDRWRGK